MGKGRIVSGGADGLYTVELLHNRDRIERELEFLAARLAELNTELTALETEREALEAARDAITAQIDATIAAAEEGEVPDVEALLAQLAQASANVQAQDVRIGLVKGRILEAIKRQQQLEAVPEDPQQQAWCADYTEDLTGEVATVEVPAEGVVGQFATWRRVQIRPGYSGRATYSAARDGQMHHRLGQVSYQAFYNAAILPGVQRWYPQYRIGTITAINRAANTCSLTIQGEDSSAQSLIIDPPDLQYTKTGVPIEYMDCNASVFEEGDRVLVEFQGRDWNSPKVIGFEQEPKACLPKYIVLKAWDFWPDTNVAPNATYWDGPAIEVERDDHPFRQCIVEQSWTTSGRDYLDISIPAEYSLDSDPDLGIMGLRHDFHSWSIFWNGPASHYRGSLNTGAEFYDGEIGTDRLTRDIFPDDWASNEIRVLAPQIDPAGFYRDQDFTFQATQLGYQMFGARSPSRTPTSYTGPKLNRVAELIGYDRIVQVDVDFVCEWRCSGDWSGSNYQVPSPCDPKQLRARGKFHLTVAKDGLDQPRGPEFLLEISEDPIPETFTIGGRTYTLHEVGWITKPSAPLNIDDRWRIPAFVYVLEGAWKAPIRRRMPRDSGPNSV